MHLNQEDSAAAAVLEAGDRQVPQAVQDLAVQDLAVQDLAVQDLAVVNQAVVNQAVVAGVVAAEGVDSVEPTTVRR